MWKRIEALPDQIRAALDALEAQPWDRLPRGVTSVVVGGLGGSAIAADLARAALAGGREPLPSAVREYRWPSPLDPGALLVLSSYSGNTEETLALAESAGETGLPRVTLTSGGKLAEWSAREGVPVFRLPGGYVPRAAAPTSWLLLTELCARAGGSVSLAGRWQSAAERLDAGRLELGVPVPERRNPAKRLARALAGRLALVYAATDALLPLALRWKQQLNENAKMPCFAGALPEIDHNEIEGWTGRGAAPQPAAAVFLRDGEEGPRHGPRLEATRELYQAAGVPTFEVKVEGGDRLGRLAALFQWGDYVSLYLALAQGVDPTPVSRVEELKRLLGRARG